MRVLFAFFLCTIFSIPTFATHIVGGEIHYEHLGGNQYKIVVKVYRDGSSFTQFDNPLPLGVFSGIASELYNVIYLHSPSIVTVPVVINNPCLTTSAPFIIEEATYDTTMALPPVEGGYTLVYQRCCRNASIVNITFPKETGATYTAAIPGILYADNADPFFNSFPPPVVCSGAPLAIDHSATDTDGDSLVYELCMPFTGADPLEPAPDPPSNPPYLNVDYTPGYSYTNPLGGNPPLSVNAVSGLLTGTPVALGQYVVGVCVKEYRNGVLLSEHRRDFQFNVVECIDYSLQQSVGPGNVGICLGDTVQLTVSTAGIVTWFPEVNISDAHGNNPLVWPQFSTVYSVMVDSPSACTDTAFVEVTVFESVFANAGNDTAIQAGGIVSFNADFQGATVAWYGPFGNLLTDEADFAYSNPVPGTYTLVVTAGSCSDTDEVLITVLPAAMGGNPDAARLSFYPNPVLIGQYVTVSLDSHTVREVELTSADGKIYRPPFSLDNACRVRVDHVPEGIYTLKLVTATGSKVGLLHIRR